MMLASPFPLALYVHRLLNKPLVSSGSLPYDRVHVPFDIDRCGIILARGEPGTIALEKPFRSPVRLASVRSLMHVYQNGYDSGA